MFFAYWEVRRAGLRWGIPAGESNEKRMDATGGLLRPNPYIIQTVSRCVEGLRSLERFRNKRIVAAEW